MAYLDKEKERETRRRWEKKNRIRLAEQAARWREANPEKVNAASRKYYRENKAKLAVVRTVWKKANPHKVKGYAKKHYEKHYQEIQEKHAAYRLANAESVNRGIEDWRKRNSEKTQEYQARYTKKNLARIRQRQRKAMAVACAELRPSYVKSLLRGARFPKELQNHPEILAIKKLQVQIHRELEGS
jgi:hypothetical protein|tara:strand:+ start:388 stop:945 length:558 start_codon:yes stop_codon:yes gene_type:complete